MESPEKRPQLLAGLMIRGRRDPEGARVGFVWGALIAAAGVLLLLDHLDIIHIGSLFNFWPLILVFFGVGHLFTRSSRAWGLILVAVGLIFQLRNLGILRVGFAELWPIAIIAVGLILMWGAMKPPIVTSGGAGPGDKADSINAVAIFGGVERRVSSPTFMGGRATSVFGGIELDLRDASIEGDEAVLDIHCVFGGVEIRVPPTWSVHSMNIPVLGGYTDKTRLAAPQDPNAPKRKTLVITGTIIFGGVEISN